MNSDGNHWLSVLHKDPCWALAGGLKMDLLPSGDLTKEQDLYMLLKYTAERAK